LNFFSYYIDSALANITTLQVPEDDVTVTVPLLDIVNEIAVVLPKSVVVVSVKLDVEPSHIPTILPALILEPFFTK